MLDESPSGIVMTTNLLGTYSLPCNAVFSPAISRISVISDFCSFHKILIIRVSEVLMHFIGDKEESENDESSTDMESSNSLRVRTLHISSPILVAQSQFFYKLFPNGMKESALRQITIQIHASEEAALMDLLNFMYSNTFSATTPTAVLGVMMVADKFEVASCMKYCSHLLRNLTMTTESALLYLDLPSNILVADEVQPLTDAAKQFLAQRFKDITKFQEDVLSLPQRMLSLSLC